MRGEGGPIPVGVGPFCCGLWVPVEAAGISVVWGLPVPAWVADLTWGPWICPLVGQKGSARKPCPICDFKGQIPQVESATV